MSDDRQRELDATVAPVRLLIEIRADVLDAHIKNQFEHLRRSIGQQFRWLRYQLKRRSHNG